MKKLLAILALISALTCAAQELPTDIKLKNGFVMKDCTVLRWHNDWAQVKYVGGVVPVAFKDLAPADRAKVEAYKATAVAKQAADDEAKAQAARAEKARLAPQQEAEARKKAELAREKEAIKQGLEDGEVAVGMTRDQVRQVYGSPLAYSTVTSAANSEWWVYAGLGTNADGTPCNLKIHFANDRVARWNNTQHTAAGYEDWNND